MGATPIATRPKGARARRWRGNPVQDDNRVGRWCVSLLLAILLVRGDGDRQLIDLLAQFLHGHRLSLARLTIEGWLIGPGRWLDCGQRLSIEVHTSAVCPWLSGQRFCLRVLLCRYWF
jgi:hypothetical protein